MSNDKPILPSGDDNDLHLEVHPSVVFKLGADLITDDMQALIELVKNAYDADSTHVSVRINTLTAIPDTTYVGSITIRDNGHGMTRDAIKRGWLTVSLSHKRAMKASGQTTPKHRTPLGDKGLGRLGAQRLGEELVMTTVSKDAAGNPLPPLRVILTWSRFADVDSLSAVPITIQELSIGSEPLGTTIEIRGLYTPAYWRSRDEQSTLQRDLATMISPYENVSGFSLTLTVDDTPIDLHKQSREILENALVSYVLDFDGEKLAIDGGFTTEFMRPQGGEAKAAFENLIERDGGYAFSEWLLASVDKRQHRPFGLAMGDDKHFLTSHIEIKLANLKKGETDDHAPVSPGPFKGEISAVSRERQPGNIFDRASEYRQFLNAINGIKIYRDGFGIPVEGDWIGLGGQWTSAGSYYSIRPNNVVGYVSLTAEHNAALEETTNREAFRDTPAYRNFMLLMQGWADHTASVQEYIRRSYNDYRRELLAESIDLTPRSTPEALIQDIRKTVAEGANSIQDVRDVNQALTTIHAAAATLESQQRDLGATRSPAVDESLAVVRTSAAEAQTIMARLDEIARRHQRLQTETDLLERQFHLVREQISDAWETVGLGLSAEALTHEMLQIGDDIDGEAKAVAAPLGRVVALQGARELRHEDDFPAFAGVAERGS